MARYRDPRAPEGRVVFGGEAFIDGVTADIDPGESTLQLFAAQGITRVEPVVIPIPETEPALEETPAPEKVTPRPRKK